jgi:hypothetical protein
MLEFYRTPAGRKFCDSTLPSLARSLERLAAAVEEANKLRAPAPLMPRPDGPALGLKSDSEPLAISGAVTGVSYPERRFQLRPDGHESGGVEVLLPDEIVMPPVGSWVLVETVYVRPFVVRAVQVIETVSPKSGPAVAPLAVDNSGLGTVGA